MLILEKERDRGHSWVYGGLRARDKISIYKCLLHHVYPFSRLISKNLGGDSESCYSCILYTYNVYTLAALQFNARTFPFQWYYLRSRDCLACKCMKSNKLLNTVPRIRIRSISRAWLWCMKFYKQAQKYLTIIYTK